MSEYQVINPYNNNILYRYSFASWDDVSKQLDILQSGKKEQKSLCAFERADILNKLAEILRAKKEDFAQIIMQETGKTITETRGEVNRAVNAALACSFEARKISGEVLDTDAYANLGGRMGMVCHKPIGTVLAITPFNFPLNIAVHKIGPAFAAGNVIYFKPSEQNYKMGEMFIEACYEAGISPNVLQWGVMEIPDLQSMIRDVRIDCINFTGGTKAADAISAISGYKKLLLELGGNDPLIVFPDGDIDKAAQTVIMQRITTAGQRCIAPKRIFLHDDIFECFKEKLVQQVKALEIGDPAKETNFMGPLISCKAADHVMDSLAKAKEEGAVILTGGKREGNVVFPTVLENISDNSFIHSHEIFGPVIPLIRFSDLDNLIQNINKSPYGLQAGLFTNDMDLVKKLFEEIDTGTLAVNDGPSFRAEHFPFGGVKQSGTGREGISYAIREMSILKTLVF